MTFTGQLLPPMKAAKASTKTKPPDDGNEVDRLIEDAQFTLRLKLDGHGIRELPPGFSRYDLRDIISAG